MSETNVRGAPGAFEVEREGETIILAPLRGPAPDRQDDQALASKVLGALKQRQAKHVVVDLHRAGGIGPTALGLYLRLWKSVRDRDGQMVLCNVSPSDTRMLCATRLNSMWRICPTRAKALETVTGRA